MHGFAQIVIHSYVNASFAITTHCVSRDSDDRYTLTTVPTRHRLPLANITSCLPSIFEGQVTSIKMRCMASPKPFPPLVRIFLQNDTDAFRSKILHMIFWLLTLSSTTPHSSLVLRLVMSASPTSCVVDAPEADVVSPEEEEMILGFAITSLSASSVKHVAILHEISAVIAFKGLEVTIENASGCSKSIDADNATIGKLIFDFRIRSTASTPPMMGMLISAMSKVTLIDY